MSKEAKWWTILISKYVLILLLFILYTFVVLRAQQKYDQVRYYDKYMTELQVYKEEQRAEAERLASLPPSVEELRKSDAELLAKVLYGVKDNSTDDLRTYCWCVFNRVDNPNYPNTLEDVVNQPSQWMRYSEDNPVIESLYDLAYSEIVKWQDESIRPTSNEFVFMSWSSSDIVLRNTFENKSSTRYWRIKQ